MNTKTSLTRSSRDKFGLYPSAVEKLSSNFSTPLYFQEYNLRHPLGIYNISIGKVIHCFKETLNELLSISITNAEISPKIHDEKLLLQVERLLYSLMEHMDDCENILRCFYPKKIKLNDQSAVSYFLTSTNNYRTHIGKVVNNLKHKQGRLRTIVFYHPNGEKHLGYFVEGINKDGSVGPNPLIHSGGSTAFSYSRDIPYHIYNLYLTSHFLCNSIDTIANASFESFSVEEKKKADIFDVLNLVQSLPLIVFPDEFEKEFPLVKLVNSQDGEIILDLDLKKHPHGLTTIKSPSKIQVIFKGDGVSREFKLPYRSP
ncbi:MAG: hypothetical protein HZB50_01980 [Chloroflexi bacterium]|nr:hypothetical protein [Chloroflexota bacterium]